MCEFEKVCITIQMENSYEHAETCFTATMLRTYFYALKDELYRPGTNMIGKIILDQVTVMARANASLLGYELTNVASAEIVYYAP